MHESLRHLDHRPWPLPDQSWIWRQSWLDLAFIHYRVSRNQLAPLLPRGVEPQEFDGSSWLGLVPFRMAGISRRPLPFFPGLSSFPELNLRTYVEVEGKPGVWFFSLDADSWQLVFGGRQFYGLPYHLARMKQEWVDGWCEFSSQRRKGNAHFQGRYRPLDDPFTAKTGSFEHWAAERYCLYSQNRKRQLVRAEVHHQPWPLQQAEVEIRESTILSAVGISPMDSDPICHFSSGVHVISFPVELLQTGS
ncbi:DUF2071 domain-containing protein [Luteolibacter pohnpeiensis]|uniref:DUF2071 domain-containing protein n=1 Tax=Luteolibacter pohnpeiensis TaxID=454153 RepID=A0A934VXH5_9BACT|nr:DUF2071 domain-containing protein [Luteolibacter pohnpeiensis]MBK1883519.1 DUF2071 domain-containing protein [Luteolibacter pohnpeiensis]